MKLFLIFLFCLLSLFSKSQAVVEKILIEKETEQDTALKFPETPAEYPGGIIELSRFISKNVTLPNEIAGAGCITIYVKFTINSEGFVSDASILKGARDCPQCDEEVLRVIKLMPKWKPATSKGKAVANTWTLPVRFGLR